MLRLIPTTLVLVTLAVAAVLPSAGCGGKKGKQTIAQRITKAKALPSPEARAAELAKIAGMRAVAKDKKGAEETLGEALAEVPEGGQPQICVPLLLTIAETYVGLGQKTPARKAVDTAVTMASTIEDPKSKATLLARIAIVQGNRETGVGDSRGAKKSLEEAATLATNEVPERFRGEALAVVAMGYVDAGLAEDAKDVIVTLDKLAEGLTDLRPKAEAYAALAAVRASLGEKDAAAELLEKASAAAKEITDFPGNRVYALVAVAKALVANGDKKGALTLLADAEKAASKVPDPDQQKTAMQIVRLFQVKLGG